jgi:cell division protein FtsL
MSRLEKVIQKKSKRKKLRFLSKVLFILFMSVNLMICIFIVDKNAKMMLGEQTYSIEPVIIDIQTFINKKIEYINGITKELLVEFNK